MKQAKQNILLLSVASGLSLLAISCGKSATSTSSGTTNAPVVSDPAALTCQPGFHSLGSTCVATSGTIADQCTQAKGTLTSVNGTQVCRFDLPIYFNGYYPYALNQDWHADPLPRLEQIHPRGNYSSFAYDQTGQYRIPVKPGDRITYSGDGTYGTRNSCDTGNNDAAKGSGTEPPRGGLVAGLLVSDETDVSLLFDASAAHPHLFSHTGYLHLGFNADTTLNITGCVHWSSYSVIFTHCQDSLGTTYTCP